MYSEDVRRHILEEVDLRRTQRFRMDGEVVLKHPVCYITQKSETVMTDTSGYHIQTDVSMHSIISNVPVPRML